MEEFEESPLSVSQDSIGHFITLKSLKEVKHGDKSTIIKIKTALQTYLIDTEVNDDEAACTTYKIHFCEEPSQLKHFTAQVLITYYRVDGKPVENSLAQIFKVSHNIRIYQ